MTNTPRIPVSMSKTLARLALSRAFADASANAFAERMPRRPNTIELQEYSFLEHRAETARIKELEYRALVDRYLALSYPLPLAA